MKRLSFSNLRVHLILLVLIAALPAWGLMLYTMETHSAALSSSSIPSTLPGVYGSTVPWKHAGSPLLMMKLALTVAWFGSDLFVLRRVRAMASANRRLADGDLGARTGVPYGSGELSQLAYTFDEMAATLEQRKAERKRAEKKIKRSREQLRMAHFGGVES